MGFESTQIWRSAILIGHLLVRNHVSRVRLRGPLKEPATYQFARRVSELVVIKLQEGITGICNSYR